MEIDLVDGIVSHTGVDRSRAQLFANAINECQAKWNAAKRKDEPDVTVDRYSLYMVLSIAATMLGMTNLAQKSQSN